MKIQRQDNLIQERLDELNQEIKRLLNIYKFDLEKIKRIK